MNVTNVKPIRKEIFIGVAGILWLIRLTVPQITINANGGTYTLEQAHNLCSSTIGVLAQSLSNTVADKCGQVAAWYDVLNLITLAAITGSIWALILIATDLRESRNVKYTK